MARIDLRRPLGALSLYDQAGAVILVGGLLLYGMFPSPEGYI